MAWTAHFDKAVPKDQAAAALNALSLSPEHSTLEAEAQLHAAKLAVKALLESIPGPRILILMNGHANSPGEADATWMDEHITITVAQQS
ncbi:MAG TPA: hypothetical protein VGR84_19225 [Candidatus Acidoferrales bacterium]|nr:hypothetical protein [Candidatus Acidoferrales bacterium]